MSSDGDQPNGDPITTAPEGADDQPQGTDDTSPAVEDDNVDYWKAMSRKNEAAAKKERAEKRELLKKLEQMLSPEQVADKDTQLAELSAKMQQVEVERLRFQVAAQKGLPPDLLEFLTGNDEDELAEKADKLLSMLPKAAKAQAASAGVKSEPPPPEKPSPAELLRIIARGR